MAGHITARLHVVAAAHAHSPYGAAWSALNRPLAPLTNEACFFFEDHVIHDEPTGVSLEEISPGPSKFPGLLHLGHTAP